MFVDERFNKRNAPLVECGQSVSMNLAPESEYTKEDGRISITLRPENDEDDRRRQRRASGSGGGRIHRRGRADWASSKALISRRRRIPDAAPPRPVHRE